MARKDVYGTAMGDAFKKAFEKGGDKGNGAEAKKATPPPTRQTSPPAQKDAAPPQPAPRAARRPGGKGDLFSNLFYNPSKRSCDEILADFFSDSASFSKKKGILDGVRAYYYSLVNIGSREAAARSRVHDFQGLKEELESYFTDLKNGRSPARRGGKAPETHPAKSDEAPGAVQKSRGRFRCGTQFAQGRAARREVEVVIGLDFGTSCTKVVIGTPFEQERAFVVPFTGYGHPSDVHLLPTHLSSERNYYFLPPPGEKGQFADLKLKLIKTVAQPDDKQHYEHAVAYLALVFRFARTWFIETYREVFGDCALRWHANVGVPSATFENDDITELYRRTVLTAWTVSIREGDINKKVVSEALALLHSGGVNTEEIELAVFPEVAAEVAGYARSEHRQEGLHLLVDVGAGTMDVCGFLLNRDDGTDQYPLLSSSVKLHGALQLDRTRKDAVLNAISHQHSTLMQDPISPVCSDPTLYIPDGQALQSRLRSAEEDLAKGCREQIRSVIMHLRRSMDPFAAAWQRGLPVFLCGGGSSIPLYKDVVAGISSWLREETTATGRARAVTLQKPDRLEGHVDDKNFHRFAVAWGLSWPSWEIGAVITKLKPVLGDGSGSTGNWWERGPDYANDDW